MYQASIKSYFLYKILERFHLHDVKQALYNTKHCKQKIPLIAKTISVLLQIFFPLSVFSEQEFESILDQIMLNFNFSRKIKYFFFIIIQQKEKNSEVALDN